MEKKSIAKKARSATLAFTAILAVYGIACIANAASAQPKQQFAAQTSPQEVASENQASDLANSDCKKCHIKASADIAAAGTKHKTAVGCLDCHNGHPPINNKIIPLCSQCHDGKPHYKIASCNICHFNPHTPLNIKMGGNVTDPCLTCHTQQITKLRENKSKHSALYCSTCHDTHGKIPDCTQCHKAHSSQQVNSDCRMCHQAHMPTIIVYNDKTPSIQCAACHREVFTTLAASTFKHRGLGCVACHQAKHKMVPQCQSCHGTPHSVSIMARFPKCGSCHGIAHDLHNFKNTKGVGQVVKPPKVPAQ